jgi:hypothetical protein
MSAVLPKVDILSICEIYKKTWRVSLSIGVRITTIRFVVYLLRIFKMFHGLMNNPVYLFFFIDTEAVGHSSLCPVYHFTKIQVILELHNNSQK